MAAALQLDDASKALAVSLTVDEIPTKLRCANCNKLAIHAVRLPCCEQSLCENCSANIPDSCPVCGHSPVDVTELKAAKGLRTTVKAFLKEKLIKKNKTAGTPVVQSVEPATPTLPSQSVPHTAANGEAEQTGTVGNADAGAEYAFEGSITPSAKAQAKNDDPVTSDTAGAEISIRTEDDQDGNGSDDEVVITTERPEKEQDGYTGTQTHSSTQLGQQQERALGPEQSQEGVYGGDFAQHNDLQQQMGSMGISGNFGDVGMNGMSFNPMAAMMNGFGGNMGMPNMMGMGMDPSMMMHPMAAMAGMGSMGDMSGMLNGMMGNYGGMGFSGMGMNGNPGFSHQGGYNNFGNSGPILGPNQFHIDRGLAYRGHNRGRYGRGFGGYGGRGTYGYGAHNFGNQTQGFQNNFGQGQVYMRQQQDFQQPGTVDSRNAQSNAATFRGSPSYEPMKSPEGSNQEVPDLQQRDDRDQSAQADGDAANANDTNDHPGGNDKHDEKAPEADGPQFSGDEEHNQGINIDPSVNTSTEPPRAEEAAQVVTQDDQSIEQSDQQGSFDNGRGDIRGRGNTRGRGGFNNAGLSHPGEQTSISTPAPPMNAPTGPRAMRAGLPNSGIYSRPQILQQRPPSPTPQYERVREHARERERERSRSRARSRGNDKYKRDESDRSRSRHRRRHRRHRTPDDDEYESDDAYARHKEKERERRKRREREKRTAEESHDRDYDDEERSSRKGGRSRSETPGSDRKRHKRDRDDKHRSRHDQSRDRDRDRDRKERKHSRRDRSASPFNGDRETENISRRKSNKIYREEDLDELDRVKDRQRARKSSKYDTDVQGDERRGFQHDFVDENRDEDRSWKHASRPGPERRRSQIIEPIDESIGFKIKGSKAAAATAPGSSNRAPPSTFAPPSGPRSDRNRANRDAGFKGHEPSAPSARHGSSDPYAEERQRRQLEREANEAMKRLGTKREREEHGSASRRGKKNRKINVRYEDEINMGD